MHTVWVRLNAVVFFGLTVLLVLSCLAAVSKFGHARHSPPVIHKLQLNTLRSLKSHGGVDRALLSFDLDVDLDPAFHWNVKQLFVYVVAWYDTPATSPASPEDGKKSVPARSNQVVLWDRIVESTDPAKRIRENNVFVKYALIDAGAMLRGRNVTLQLQWDHMPITGMLHIDQQKLADCTSFELPSEYR